MIPEATCPHPGNGSTGFWSAIDSIQRGLTSVRCKIRHILADHNADRKDLFRPVRQGLPQAGAPATPSGRHQAAVVGVRGLSSPAVALAKKIKAFAARHRSGKPRPGRSSRGPAWGRDRRGDPSELGDVSRPQRQGGLCLRGAGTRRQAERGQEIQRSCNQQTRIGTVAVGPGGVGLAAVNTSPKWMAVSPGEEAQRHQASHRGGGQELLCVLYAMPGRRLPTR